MNYEEYLIKLNEQKPFSEEDKGDLRAVLHSPAMLRALSAFMREVMTAQLSLVNNLATDQAAAVNDAVVKGQIQGAFNVVRRLVEMAKVEEKENASR